MLQYNVQFYNFKEGIKVFIKLTEHKSLEVHGYIWNPLRAIEFETFFRVGFTGSYSPCIDFTLNFFCIGFAMFFYDNRHEDERE